MGTWKESCEEETPGEAALQGGSQSALACLPLISFWAPIGQSHPEARGPAALECSPHRPDSPAGAEQGRGRWSREGGKQQTRHPSLSVCPTSTSWEGEGLKLKF